MTFTTQQLDRIVATCDAQNALRKRLGQSSTRYSYVRGAALGAMDNLAGHEGFENAHDELLEEMEKVDCDLLWRAMESHVAARMVA